MQATLPEPAVAGPGVRMSSWKSLAIALSFANLCYLRIWKELLTYTPADTYLMDAPFPRAAYFAVIANVLLIGMAGWGAALLVERSGSRVLWRIARALFFAVVSLRVAGPLRALLAPRLSFLGTRAVVAVAVGAVLVALMILWRWPEPLRKALCAGLLIVFPLVPLTVGQALWRAARYDASEFRNGSPAPRLAQKRTPRVLWVILDEWDYRLTFLDRPAGVELPEIDRLRRESLDATNAHPAGMKTLVCLPALITGRPVVDVVQRDARELLLIHSGGARPRPWSKEPNVFDAARAAGFDTAAVGFYHPYCRVLPSSLTHCESWSLSMQYNSMGQTFGDLVWNQTRSIFETWGEALGRAPFGQLLATIGHARTYREMLARSLGVATDQSYGLTFLHLPVPHPPFAYNRRTGRFDLKNSPVQGYADSLVLADRTVGAIRHKLEQAGMWDSTTVLFTTDHPYRGAKEFDGKEDPRIPFLLKMAGAHTGLEFEPEFNTLVTRELVMAILRREVATPGDAARWIEAHRTAAAR